MSGGSLEGTRGAAISSSRTLVETGEVALEALGSCYQADTSTGA
jgi:hypothetical protein